jgi:hypothetical protein
MRYTRRSTTTKMASTRFFATRSGLCKSKNVSSKGQFYPQTRHLYGSRKCPNASFLGKNIKKVAVLGGSGSFAIKNAIRAGADAFLTADLKYHNFYEAENQLLLADIGHFESERYTKNYIVDFLQKKIPNFAIEFYQKKIQILLSTYKDYGEYKRINVEEKLRALYDLQLIDTRIDEIRNVRGELPLEVEDLEDEVAGLLARQDKLKKI